MKLIAKLIIAFGMIMMGSSLAFAQGGDGDTVENRSLLGGTTTIVNMTPNAFGQVAPGLAREYELLFFVGNSFFNQNWVTAPASTTARDGLGPFFNARSCAGCHFKDGRGRPPEFEGESPTGFLLRLSIPGATAHGAPLADPVYGGQFQDNAIGDILPEGSYRIEYIEIAGTFNDGTPYSLRQPIYYLENLNYGDMDADIMVSPRVANQMIGMGLLEAIPESTILAMADPDDLDEDGISGRPNYVWDYVNNTTALGRFGWKANQPNIHQQVAGAFAGDIGITTSLFPSMNCTDFQDDCMAAINGGEPEIEDEDLERVIIYASSLAVPMQRNWDDPEVQRGQQLFDELQCAACHTPTIETGTHPTFDVYSHQTIHPYTDLLLHDMGEGLADNRPDFEATGTEWRTAPLWGIGLFETVNGHTYYLHDGRARSLEEAILWHGGEGANARDLYIALSVLDREALLAFLRSL